MRQLRNRVEALETVSPTQSRHIVQWCRGSSFDDALERSVCPDVSHERFLIEIVPVTGGHGEPIVSSVPDDDPEVLKAHAWAGGGT